jgi:hypothetical protein
MNVIKLYGGLGNQMFQYAFGKVQRQNGIEVMYNITRLKDTHPYENKRHFVLDRFNTDIQLCNYPHQKVIRERDFSRDLLKKDNCNFLGYWQRLEIFDHILPLLRKEFCIREKFYTDEYLEFKKKILSKESVSVHVRRSDYITNEAFNVLPFSYYLEALKHTRGNIFIFSDDIKWCKQNFKQEYFDRDIVFVHLKEYLDFELMRLCTHHVIANSTFSWWAAYLNNSADRIVVCPKQWRVREKDQKKFMGEFSLPDNWIKL